MKLALLIIALATAAPAQDKPRGPVRVSGGVMQGALLHMVAPDYPPDAKAQHVSGIVVMHAVIGKDGKIANLTVVSGPEMLTAAALDAVNQWTYKPYLLNGEPTEVDTTITVNFTFNGNPGPAGNSKRVELDTAELQSYVIQKVRPVYPAAAKAARIAGSVVMHVIIGTDGRVASLTVLSGPLELRQSATEAVYQWTYKPYMTDGMPREVDTEITINFSFGN